MTSVVPLPNHRDVSRALCAALAVFREQSKAVEIAADTAGNEEFTAALLTAFATLLGAKVTDVEDYVLQWISVELALADAEEQPDD